MTFYALRKDGLAPASMMVRKKRIISREAAADWRRRMEAETAKQEASQASLPRVSYAPDPEAVADQDEDSPPIIEDRKEGALLADAQSPP